VGGKGNDEKRGIEPGKLRETSPGKPIILEAVSAARSLVTSTGSFDVKPEFFKTDVTPLAALRNGYNPVTNYRIWSAKPFGGGGFRGMVARLPQT
jgi:hypothetical protein